MTRHRDHALQALGLIIGFIPAVLLIFALPLGLFLCLFIAVGLAFPRLRSLAYGALCALLILPGLALSMSLLH